MIWSFIVVFLLGVSMGCVFTEAANKKTVNGCLRIDSSDPTEPPYLFLELEENPEVLKHKKYVTLQVNTKSYISQK